MLELLKDEFVLEASLVAWVVFPPWLPGPDAVVVARWGRWTGWFALGTALQMISIVLGAG